MLTSRMRDGAPFVGHDGDRETHHRKLLFVASPIDGIDIALEAIVTVVEIRDHQIEAFDNGLADGVDAVGPAHEYKVVSPDMADKSFCTGQFSHYRSEDAAGDDEDFISTAIAIAIVKGFKIVDIDIGQGEGLSALNSGGGFKQDRGVAREAGEGVRIKRTGQAAEAEAHTVDHVFGSIGDRDEIVDSQFPPVDIVESAVPDEEDQRQSPEEGIVLEVSRECFRRMAPSSFCGQDEAGRIVNEFVQREVREVAFHDLETGFLQG